LGKPLQNDELPHEAGAVAHFQHDRRENDDSGSLSVAADEHLLAQLLEMPLRALHRQPGAR